MPNNFEGRITEAKLTDAVEDLLLADKEEVERRHHAKFPAERNSVRGAVNFTRTSMLIDLLTELFGRTDKSAPAENVYDVVVKLVDNNSLHVLADALEQGIIARIKTCSDEEQLLKLKTTRKEFERMSRRFQERR